MQGVIAMCREQWGNVLTDEEIAAKHVRRRTRDVMRCLHTTNTHGKKMATALLSGVKRSRVWKDHGAADADDLGAQRGSAHKTALATSPHSCAGVTVLAPAPPPFNPATIPGATFIAVPHTPPCAPVRRPRARTLSAKPSPAACPHEAAPAPLPAPAAATPAPPPFRVVVTAAPTGSSAGGSTFDQQLQDAYETACSSHDDGAQPNNLHSEPGQQRACGSGQSAQPVLQRYGVCPPPEATEALLRIAFEGGRRLLRRQAHEGARQRAVLEALASRQTWRGVATALQATMGPAVAARATAAKCMEKYRMSIALSKGVVRQLFRWSTRARAAVELRGRLHRRERAVLCEGAFLCWKAVFAADTFRRHRLVAQALRRMRNAFRSAQYPRRGRIRRFNQDGTVADVLGQCAAQPEVRHVFEAWKSQVRHVTYACQQRLAAYRSASCGVYPTQLRQKATVRRLFAALRVPADVHRKRAEQVAAADKWCVRRCLSGALRRMTKITEGRVAQAGRTSVLEVSAWRRWRYECLLRQESRVRIDHFRARQKANGLHSTWGTWRKLFLERVLLRTHSIANCILPNKRKLVYTCFIFLGAASHAFFVRVWQRWKQFAKRSRLWSAFLQHVVRLRGLYEQRACLHAWRVWVGGTGDDRCVAGSAVSSRTYVQVLHCVRQMLKGPPARQEGPLDLAVQLLEKRRLWVHGSLPVLMLLANTVSLVRKAFGTCFEQDSQEESRRQQIECAALLEDESVRSGPADASLADALRMGRVPPTKAVRDEVDEIQMQRRIRLRVLHKSRQVVIQQARQAVLKRGGAEVVAYITEQWRANVAVGWYSQRRAQLSFGTTCALLLEGSFSSLLLSWGAFLRSEDSDDEGGLDCRVAAGQWVPSLPVPPADFGVPPEDYLRAKWYPVSAVVSSCAARLVVQRADEAQLPPPQVLPYPQMMPFAPSAQSLQTPEVRGQFREAQTQLH